MNNLKEVIETWLEIAQEDNKNIPEPCIYTNSEYSGKFTLRTPKSLHRQLVQEAEREGVSLNQLVLSLISYNLGAKKFNECLAINDTVPPQRGHRIIYEMWDNDNFPTYETNLSQFHIPVKIGGRLG